MVTIRDIANFAQVSTATVSRVINNDQTYKMTQETRDRVWKAVAQLGYKPLSKAINTSKPSIQAGAKIGCILSVTKEKYKDPYFMSILSGIEERAAEKGYSIAFLRTFYELEDKNLLYDTFKDAPNAMIIMETLAPDLYGYIRAHVPICVGIDTMHSDIDNIGYNHLAAAQNAVQYLIDRGHKNIGFIGGGGPSGNIMNSRRFLGYYTTMIRNELKVEQAFVKNSQWDEEECVKQTREIMSCDNPPSAIFAASDVMAIAVLSALYSMRISVPEQVAVIGLSNIELSQFSSPPLTTVEIPAHQIGILAVDAVERRIQGSLHLPQDIYLPTSIVKRISV